jgi:hypothetical protein
MNNLSKRVFDVIIGNTLVSPASGQVALGSLTSGQVIFYDQDLDGAVTSADSSIYIAQYDSDYGSRSSKRIEVKNIRKVAKTAYSAATVKQVTVTIAAGDAVNNTLYVLEIAEKRDVEYINKPKKRYEYMSDSSATNAEIATGLVAAINADKTANFTASVGTNVITISGKDFSVIFDAIIMDGFTSATVIATTQTPFRGNGTYEIVAAFEEASKGYRASVNRREFVVSPTYYATPGKTYVTFTIEHGATIEDLSLGTTKQNVLQTLLFIDSTASSSLTALDTLFNTSLGIAYSNF